MKSKPSEMSAVNLIKYLNGRTGWHGHQYRSLCGEWLGKNNPQKATSYTKDYSGSFTEKGELDQVNIEVDGKEIVSIDRSLLEIMMHDIGRDINNPHIIKEARRILNSDHCMFDQLRKLQDLFQRADA